MINEFLETLGNAIATNFWLGILLAFLAGIIIVFTPCSLSSIPLLVGYVGGAGTTKKKAFLYSVFICLGQTIVFVVLGILAGTLGMLMGIGGFGKVWTFILSALMIFMALEVWGITNVLSKFQRKKGCDCSGETCEIKDKPSKKGILGALLVGMTGALFASPCATPVLTAMLAYTTQTSFGWWAGGILLLAYSIGHSLLLILAGTSIGFVRQFNSSKK
ncbi:MAG: cytochrome c biogenesis protein CcdA [Clostridia bacterium]|nr:cytochrome c biogenesis protein CcdA [Clostridia bacterium]